MNYITFKSLIFLFSASIIVKADQPMTKTLDNFDSTREVGSWMSVNDGVMGGRSKGAPAISKKSTLIFKGDISLENNGGFSSVRHFLSEFQCEKAPPLPSS